MAEHDYVIANQNGANTRSDLNNALGAIVSNNSKATAPTTTYAFQWWADTAADILKQRNAADSAWINILTLSTGAPLGTLSSSLLSGTHTNFTSTGIDDNATSTAITIDASENVGIGTTAPTAPIHINSASHPQVKFGGSSALYYWGLDREASAGDLAFTNANGGAETERVRILAGGGITFNGDTAAANALDDYEEGTWTPGATAGAYTSATGTYTKIGRLVHLTFQIVTGAAQGSNYFQITNLPFSAYATSVNSGGVSRTDVGSVNYTLMVSTTNVMLRNLTDTDYIRYNSYPSKKINGGVTYEV